MSAVIYRGETGNLFAEGMDGMEGRSIAIALHIRLKVREKSEAVRGGDGGRGETERAALSRQKGRHGGGRSGVRDCLSAGDSRLHIAHTHPCSLRQSQSPL